MAIAMAQAGGIGVIHRNLEPDLQAAQVRQVKKFESGMVVNPVTIAPEATLADAHELMKAHGISGIPVVEGGGNGKAGKLVGILTNRDVRFATDPRQKVAELMTKDRLVTVREGVGQDEAKRLLHQYRIEKLLVHDGKGHLTGLLTLKDTEQAVLNPQACKDQLGRLRVAGVIGVREAHGDHHRQAAEQQRGPDQPGRRRALARLGERPDEQGGQEDRHPHELHQVERQVGAVGETSHPAEAVRGEDRDDRQGRNAAAHAE